MKPSRWLAILLTLGAATTAYAQPRVYVVAVSNQVDLEAGTAAVGGAARTALRRNADVNWRGPDQRFLGYDSGALERLNDARSKLEEGQTAYVSFELERAVELLTDSIQGFESAVAVIERPDDFGQALLFLGAAQVLAGDVRAARGTFDRLHTQVPSVRPDLETFPPEVIQAYEHAAPRDRARPSSTLVIESEPPSGVAYVDFVPRGRTPVHVDGLVGGTHMVRVIRPGAAPVGETAAVRMRRSQTVNVTMSPVAGVEGLSRALDKVGEEPLGAEANDAVRNLAGMLELDAVGVIQLSGDAQGEVQLALSFYDARSGKLLLAEEASGSYAGGTLWAAAESLVESALGKLVASAKADPGGDNVISTAVEPKKQDDEGKSPVYKKWWFWAILGVAVAGGVTVAALTAGGGDDLGQNRDGVLVFDLGPAPSASGGGGAGAGPGP